MYHISIVNNMSSVDFKSHTPPALMLAAFHNDYFQKPTVQYLYQMPQELQLCVNHKCIMQMAYSINITSLALDCFVSECLPPQYSHTDEPPDLY